MDNEVVPISEPEFKPAAKKRKKRTSTPYLQVKVDGKTFRTSGYSFEAGFLRVNLLKGDTLYIRLETIRRIEVSGAAPTAEGPQVYVPRLAASNTNVVPPNATTSTMPPAHITRFNNARNAALAASMSLGDFGDQ
jgi:hypothetical protein